MTAVQNLDVISSNCNIIKNTVFQNVKFFVR